MTQQIIFNIDEQGHAISNVAVMEHAQKMGWGLSKQILEVDGKPLEGVDFEIVESFGGDTRLKLEITLNQTQYETKKSIDFLRGEQKQFEKQIQKFKGSLKEIKTELKNIKTELKNRS